jgi:hypothetical protein
VAPAAFLVAPLLVLAGAWFLLTALDDRTIDSAVDRRRQAALGAGLLAAAVVLTAVGIALDDQAPAPPRTPSTSAGTT